MALTIKGATSLIYGTAGVTAVTGITSLTSFEAGTENVVNATAKGTDGAVSAHVFGSPKYTVRAEGFSSTTTAPTLGASIATGSGNAFTQSTSVIASNEDFLKISLSGEGHAGAQ